MDPSKKTTLALLGLFVGSGCSALIYEIVWLQQLGLVLGATSVSLAILLTSFMGGMCLGSLALPRVVSAARHPLRVYAVLELLIGVCGLAILWAMPLVSRVYCSFALPGSDDLVARALVALTLLLPPTILMGATLPAVARWVKSSRVGLSQLGFFYGANTFGAVIGSLLAGLYLLPFFDVVVATCVAAAINASVAVGAWRLAATSSAGGMPSGSQPTPNENPQHREVLGTLTPPRSAGVSLAPYFVIGLSGLTALGAEVVWTRWLGLLFGPTTYTFSILLAVFLLGLGVGSWGGAWLARRVRSPGAALAISQLSLMAAIPFGAFMIVSVLPYWLHARDANQSLMTRMSLDVIRALAAFLPATLLWGASFPLSVATAADERRDTASLVGGLYSANTLGAIVGTLARQLVRGADVRWSVCSANVDGLRGTVGDRDADRTGRTDISASDAAVRWWIFGVFHRGRGRPGGSERSARLWSDRRELADNPSVLLRQRRSRFAGGRLGIRGRVSLFPCGRKSRGNEQPQRHAARSDCSDICRRWCIRNRGPRWSSAVVAE